MKPQAKLVPGDIRIIIGMIALLGGAIWLPIVLLTAMPEHSALLREGRTVEGQVVGKQEELTGGARRQRRSASENFYFEVAFDPAQGVPFGSEPATPTAAPRTATPRSGADIVAGLDIGKPAAATVYATGGGKRVRVNAGSFERYEAYRIGEAISLTYLPSDPAGARLTELVESQNPWLSLAGSAGLLVAGLILCLTGVRRRRRGDIHGNPSMEQ